MKLSQGKIPTICYSLFEALQNVWELQNNFQIPLWLLFLWFADKSLWSISYTTNIHETFDKKIFLSRIFSVRTERRNLLNKFDLYRFLALAIKKMFRCLMKCFSFYLCRSRLGSKTILSGWSLLNHGLCSINGSSGRRHINRASSRKRWSIGVRSKRSISSRVRRLQRVVGLEKRTKGRKKIRQPAVSTTATASFAVPAANIVTSRSRCSFDTSSGDKFQNRSKPNRKLSTRSSRLRSRPIVRRQKWLGCQLAPMQD